MIHFLSLLSATTHDEYRDPGILNSVYLDDFELQTSQRSNQPQRAKGVKWPMTYIQLHHIGSE
jgi:hypothetical protein